MKLTKVIFSSVVAIIFFSNVSFAGTSSAAFYPKLVWCSGEQFTVQDPAGNSYYFKSDNTNTGVQIGIDNVKAMLATMPWCIQNNKQVSIYYESSSGTTLYPNQFSIIN